MSIERSLGKLTPKPDGQYAGRPMPSPGLPSPGVLSVRGLGDSNDQRVEQGVVKSSGNASLDVGNDFGGMPQVSGEARGWAETAIDVMQFYGISSGNIRLNIAHGSTFYVNLTGPATITIDASDYPIDAFEREPGVGVDISISVIVSKSEGPLTIYGDIYAPFGEAPDLMQSGFYEIGISVMIIGSESITRVYPCARPPRAEPVV